MKVLKLPNKYFLPQVCMLVDEGKKVSIPLKGMSMRPFFESERDVGVLTKVQQLKKGDVVLAEIAKGKFVFHRIDKIVIDGTETKKPCMNPDADVTLRGDGNVRGTEHCKLKDVRAICLEVVRNGKTWNIEKSKRWKLYSWYWTHTLCIRRYQLALYRLLWRHELPQRWTKKNKRQSNL